jgi:uncharacterized membrane protein YedE/YeeE
MLSALIGGALIGLAATYFWLENGRVAGVSGILRGAVLSPGDRREMLPFLAGLVSAGLAFAAFGARPAATAQPLAVLLVAGVLVGFGTRLGRGCTSGHGVCGLSRLSRRSLAATLTFMAVAAATVFLTARLAPGWLAR